MDINWILLFFRFVLNVKDRTLKNKLMRNRIASIPLLKDFIVSLPMLQTLTPNFLSFASTP